MTTAARKAPPIRGATIAGETAAPRACWPRVPAGPAIRAAETQISSDIIGGVNGAVDILETNNPLHAILCYRRGFIGGQAKQFERPFVRLRRRRKKVQVRWALALARGAQQRDIEAH